MLRNVFFVIVGFVLGSAVNMALVVAGSALIPAPPGIDMSDTQSIANSIHLFQAKHFIFPFMAHAFGTFIGALAAGYLGWKSRTILVWSVAGLFFSGGVATTFMIPAPAAFIVADLALAYAPMALLALWVLNTLVGKSDGPDWRAAA